MAELTCLTLWGGGQGHLIISDVKKEKYLDEAQLKKKNKKERAQKWTTSECHKRLHCKFYQKWFELFQTKCESKLFSCKMVTHTFCTHEH